MNKLSFLIDAVEENNQLNQAQWSDWSSASDIADAYLTDWSDLQGWKESDTSLSEEEEYWLRKLIDTNGAVIDEAIEAAR